MATSLGTRPSCLQTHTAPLWRPVWRLLVLAIAVAGMSVVSASAQTTFLTGGVRSHDRDVVGSWGWTTGMLIVAENEETGERWEVQTEGLNPSPWAGFTFTGLPPGRYRLQVEALATAWFGPGRGVRAAPTRVILREYQPVHAEIDLFPVDDDGHPSHTTRSVVRPETPVDTCRIGRPNEWPWPYRAALWGVVRTPEGTPASGVRVHLEAIGGVTRDPFRTVVTTTGTGCYGVYGLWPGRYHVFVDEAWLSFDGDVDVVDADDVPTRRDIGLVAGRTPSSAGDVRPGWYSRLGLRQGDGDQLRRAVQRMAPEIAEASREHRVDPGDLAHVTGIVFWPYARDEVPAFHRVADARVAFRRDGASDEEALVAITESDGSYDAWLPQGRYHITIDHPPFKPLTADVLVLPEGMLVESGRLAGREPRSGIYPAAVTLRSGLLATLNVSLWLPVEERSGVETSSDGSAGAVTVRSADYAALSAGPTDVTVSREQLEALPLVSGRTVQAALALVPGVVVTESNGNLAQFTGVGQRRFSNRLTIDGIYADLAVDVVGRGIGQAGSGALPATSTLGGTQILAPLGAIDEIRVQSAGVAPAQRSTPGVQTSIVTRAGSNQRTMDLFAQGRPDSLAARDFLENAGRTPKHETKAWTTGVSFGAPLMRDRLFSFSVWEGQGVDRPVITTIRAPTQAARDTAASPMVRSILAAYAVGNGRDLGLGLAELTQRFPLGSRLSSLSVRLDGNVSTRDRWFTRLQRGSSRGDQIISNSDVPWPSFTNTESTLTTAATGGWSRASSSWTHDLRANVTAHMGKVDATAAKTLGSDPLPRSYFLPSDIGASDVAIAVRLFLPAEGIIFAGPSNRAEQRQLQVSESVGWIHGKHEVRGGFELQCVQAESIPTPVRLTYVFGGIADLKQERVRQVVLEQQAAVRSQRTSWSGFVQDTWQLSPKLSVEIGARYTVRPAPVNSLTSTRFSADALPPSETPSSSAGTGLWKNAWSNIAPHLAGVYQLRSTSNWGAKLRGSWGLAFDDLSAPRAVVFRGGTSTSVLGPSVFPLPPGALGKAALVASENETYSIPHNLRSPRSYDWQVGIDQSLGRTQRVGVAYVGTAGRDLVYSSRYSAEGETVYAYSNDARSDYNALLVDYAKRVSRGLQARAVYTWSHAIDTDSGEDVIPNPPTGLVPASQNRGPADFDRRHLLRVSASYQVPSAMGSRLGKLLAGWQFSAVGTIQSGSPINVFTWRDSEFGQLAVRPDLNADASVWSVEPGSPSGRRLNVDAFSTPSDLRQGTLGRNSLRATWIDQLDLACSRSLKLGTTSIQFRLDVFNIFNVANFGAPRTDMTDPLFGQVTQSYARSLGTGTLSLGGLAPVDQVGGPRAIRVGVRVQM